MALETLDEKKLLPEKFEPLRNNRWVFQLEGIDAFLLKSVSGPELTAHANAPEVIIALHNVVGGDQNERLIAWLNSNEEREAVVKHLDPVGTVVEKWRFSARPTKIWFSKLNYEDGGLLTTYVALEAKQFRIGD